MKKAINKNLFFGSLVTVIIFGLSLASCGNKITPSPTANSNDTKEIENIYAPEVAKKAPLFTELADPDGNLYSLENYLGQNVLLIFETTYCTYCAQERPILEEFKKKYGDEITILGIDIDEEPNVVKEHLQKHKISYPWLIDRESLTTIGYLTFGTPKHFFIDKEGYIQDIIQGFANLEMLEIGLTKVREANEFY